MPYFAADEARTLDAVLRNDQGAVEGRSDTPFRILIMKSVLTTMTYFTSSRYCRIREDGKGFYGSKVR